MRCCFFKVGCRYPATRIYDVYFLCEWHYILGMDRLFGICNRPIRPHETAFYALDDTSPWQDIAIRSWEDAT